MRLYSLDQRVGKRERRLYPWFDPPEAEAPRRYSGWVWDPAQSKWLKKSEDRIKIKVKTPAYPEPDYTPREAQDLYAPGWYWDGRAGIWKEVPIPSEFEYVEDPRPLEPDFLPRPAQGLTADGWKWNGRAGVWQEAAMPLEPKLIQPEHPPEPSEWPSRRQPAEVPGWRYSFMYMVWEKTPMPRIKVWVPKKRPPKPVYIPGPAKPSEVKGWRYSEIYEVWEKADMPVRKIDVTPKRGPKPTLEPGPARSFKVEGWKWSRKTNRWIATIIYSETLDFTPPTSLPPGVTQEAVNMVFPASEQYKVFYDNLIAMGLTPTEARRIGGSMVDGFWQMTRSTAEKVRAEQFYRSLYPDAVAVNDMIEKIGVYGALIALSAIIGAVMGDILRRVILPDEEIFRISGGIITYLLGPENWSYSRQIGTSVTGRQYFSSCEGIGTTYVRHFRGHGIGQSDTIDFPGGFVETGYKVPYFVKYTWDHWDLSYVGMLSTSGAFDYVLKVGHDFTGEIYRHAEIVPEDEWCPNFTFYL